MAEKERRPLPTSVMIVLIVMTAVAVFAVGIVLYLQIRGMVSLLPGSSGGKNGALPMPYRDEVRAASEKYGVEEARIYAVIRTESSFRADVVSEAGAIGLMQMLPETYEEQCAKRGVPYNKDDLKDPAVNIDFCTEYLATLYNMFGSWENAHMAYHAGAGSVRSWLEDPECSKDGMKIDRIPSDATAKYLGRISAAYDAYAAAIRSERETEKTSPDESPAG